jgi:hypothetical protein
MAAGYARPTTKADPIDGGAATPPSSGMVLLLLALLLGMLALLAYAIVRVVVWFLEVLP